MAAEDRDKYPQGDVDAGLCPRGALSSATDVSFLRVAKNCDSEGGEKKSKLTHDEDGHLHRGQSDRISAVVRNGPGDPAQALEAGSNDEEQQPERSVAEGLVRVCYCYDSKYDGKGDADSQPGLIAIAAFASFTVRRTSRREDRRTRHGGRRGDGASLVGEKERGRRQDWLAERWRVIVLKMGQRWGTKVGCYISPFTAKERCHDKGGSAGVQACRRPDAVMISCVDRYEPIRRNPSYEIQRAMALQRLCVCVC